MSPAALLTMLACTTPERVAPAEGVDVVAAKLTATTDLCAWEDGILQDVEPEEAPEGYVEPTLANAYQPCLDGQFWVGSRVLELPEGHLEDVFASATFFRVTEPETRWQRGEWLDPAEGVDDCGLVLEHSEGQSSGGDLEWLDPGSVDLLTPSTTIPFPPPPSSNANWDLPLSELGYGAEPGGAYGLSVSGSTGGPGAPDGSSWGPFAAIELPELVLLPEPIEVTAPLPLGPGVALPREDLALTWTGTSGATVQIRLSTADEAPWYTLLCEVEDDGAFTVPGELLEALPVTEVAYLELRRREESWIGTATGRSIHAIGHSGYEAWQLVVP